MKLRIDDIEIEAEEGQTILDCAEKAGIVIPTLCHKKGIEHYSSCMVCIVQDKTNKSFVPSCSALVRDGMDIDASGEEVINLRKNAVLLLLSEHRAECEAQCRVVCPEGYNIPLLNRLLIAGKFKDAADLCRSEIKRNELKCYTCAAYCENACRRKKIDIPVSIRNLKIFIHQNLSQYPGEFLLPENQAGDFRTLFFSRIGKLEDAEQKEWLMECNGDITRHREITDFNSASSEAQSCMHCDCRAAENCRLRDIAGKFGLKDPKGKFVNSPIKKKINKKTGLIFENAKCIKCGLCVRACGDSKAEPSLCFINRGFVSIISEPLTGEFVDISEIVTEKSIDICPTGALGHFYNIQGK